MGADPGNSALNKYLQSWDVTNLFVSGASAFPHNSGYNPTVRSARSPIGWRTPSARGTSGFKTAGLIGGIERRSLFATEVMA